MGVTRINVAGWKQCPWFQKGANVASALEHLYPNTYSVNILEFANRDAFRAWLPTKHAEIPSSSNHSSSPYVFTDDNTFLGGFEDLKSLAKKGMPASAAKATPMLRGAAGATADSGAAPLADVVDSNIPSEYDYDLIVIGGGSGGLSCSKQAAKFGAKVAVLDFVKPSPQGTQWGLGGTCVNVGCIPKKLMHQTALLGDELADAKSLGWAVDGKGATHTWEKMVESVQNHIMSLNFGYRVQLRQEKVDYINALGTFVDPHTIQCVDKAGKETLLTARRVVLAVGGRPAQLSCPGAELAITSDDLFSKSDSPGKTLVVGASYVALECAGFLHGVKMDVTVMVRSIVLRGFDQQIAENIKAYMAKEGVKFINGKVPVKLEKVEGGRTRVFWGEGPDEHDDYDTVLVAIGRHADTGGLGLDKAGVVTESNGKIKAQAEQTNIAHIYAIGDMLYGREELTPVAIQAGHLLASRLYDNQTQQMDYEKVCTTVFTPLEYGCVGLSEEDAQEKYANVDVYHTNFTPLEWFPCEHRSDNDCYAKAIVDLDDDQRVLGLHFLGPHAGEVIQGFGVGMRMGMTYKDLNDTVGIHPTCAEELTTLKVTKSSGGSAMKSGC